MKFINVRIEGGLEYNWMRAGGWRRIGGGLENHFHRFSCIFICLRIGGKLKYDWMRVDWKRFGGGLENYFRRC